MPFAIPAQGRPGHRRSFSNIVPPPSLASTTATGAFASLGALPTRRRSTRPTFQLGIDDGDESQDDSPEDARPTKLTINTDLHDDEHPHLPPLRLKNKLLSSFHAQQPASVPFPRSSPLPSPTLLSDKRPSPVARPVSRTTSTPVLLANGKPLKSSLKSSSSSPNIPFPPQSLVPSIMFPQLHQSNHSHHQRACSAPATPNLDVSPTSSSSPTSPTQQPLTPSLPSQKNVHFPSQEEGGLTTVRVYKRSAKPASLLRKGEETETETEGESSSVPTLPFVWGSRWNNTNNARAPAYPFPKFSGSPFPKKHSPLADHNDEEKAASQFEIDMKNSSPIPSRGAERAEGNVYFESLAFVCEDGSENLTKPLTLTGTVLVRNIAYHKTVAVRYTLDDWNTTNDVIARHDKSLNGLPERFLLASLPDAQGGERREVVCKPCGFEDVFVEAGGAPLWDRFRFNINLERYEGSIQQRTMWFVGRYSTAPPGNGVGLVPPSGEEWWDNNSGLNYRIAFLKKTPGPEVDGDQSQKDEIPGYKRNVVVSAPPVFSPSKPILSPPQISTSLSYPIGLNGVQKERAAAAHAALTQRLKGFTGFTNYAAPIPSRSSSISKSEEAETSSTVVEESSTANTSPDSTPLQTPTMEDDSDFGVHIEGDSGHDMNANVLMHGEAGRHSESELRTGGSLQMQDGHPATFVPLKGATIENTDRNAGSPNRAAVYDPNFMEIGKDQSSLVEHEPSVFEPTPVHITGPPSRPSTGLEMELGTSPPFSSLADMELRNGMFASKESGLHWQWGGESKVEESETNPTPTNIVSPMPTHVTADFAHIRTSSPDQRSSSPSTIPQRKRTHAHSHSLSNPAPTFSVGLSSPSSSRSGSSGSETPSALRSFRSSVKNGVPTRPKLTSPQSWPIPPQRSVMSPPPTSLSSRRITEIKDKDDNSQSVVQSPSISRNGSTEMSSLSPANDAVYQAFVRQWCFAQGPTPNVGSPKKSERISPLSPDVAVR